MPLRARPLSFLLLVLVTATSPGIAGAGDAGVIRPLTAVGVSGQAFLEGQIDASGIKVRFEARSPSAQDDSTYTGSTGFYACVVTAGNYRIDFSRDGYVSQELPGEWLLAPPDTTLPDVVLHPRDEELSGALSGILPAGHRYSVVGPIEVPAGDTLLIMPGVRVAFLGAYQFDVYGCLLVQGTETDSVRFTSGLTPVGGWGPIAVHQAKSRLAYLVTEYGSINTYGGSVCHIEHGRLAEVSPNSALTEVADCRIATLPMMYAECCPGRTVFRSSSFPGVRLFGNWFPGERSLEFRDCSIGSEGLACWGADTVVVTGCTVNASGCYNSDECAVGRFGALAFEQTHALLVTENVIRSVDLGMSVMGGDRAVVRNNTLITDRDTGRYSAGMLLISLQASSAVTSNVICHSDVGVDSWGSIDSLSYNCLDDVSQPFTGGPNGIGTIITANANGDSCDAWYNIFQDPQFVDANAGDYHLTAGSPCINAGDPGQPPDPDGTTADVGAFYFPLSNPTPPEILIQADPTTGPLPLGVDFRCVNVGGPITSFLWNFGDDRTSSLFNPVHTFTEAGTLTVFLTAVGPGGSDTAQTEITVLPSNWPPQCDLSGAPRFGFPGQEVCFTSVVVGDSCDYHWTFGDGGESSAPHPCHVYADTGSFEVCLTVTNPHGQGLKCKPGYVTIHDPGTVVADFTFSDSLGVAPLPILFTDRSLGLVETFHWWFGDGGESTDRYPAHSYLSIGTFFPRLAVSGPGGADTLTASHAVRVYPTAPSIVSVQDVLDDQGGRVWVRWAPSGLDGAVANGVVGYSVWLRDAQSNWTRVGTALAAQDSVYTVLAATLADTTAEEGICWSVYRVTAHTTNPGVFYSSLPDSGYSVDNLPPSVPQSLEAEYNQRESRIVLTWNPAVEHDLRYYAVYRSNDPVFDPSPQTFRANTPTPLLFDLDFDPEGIYYYRVVALDHAGNASEPSMPTDPISPSGAPGGSVPLAYDLGPLSPNPARNAAAIRVALPEPAEVHVGIFALDGTRLATLAAGPRGAGVSSLHWAGRDANGKLLSSGIYLVRMEAEGRSHARFVKSRKLVWIR
jgi:PKD repeat protein